MGNLDPCGEVITWMIISCRGPYTSHCAQEGKNIRRNGFVQEGPADQYS